MFLKIAEAFVKQKSSAKRHNIETKICISIKLMKMRTAKNSIRCLYNEYHDDRIEGVDRIEAYVVQVYKRPAKRDQSRDIAKG